MIYSTTDCYGHCKDQEEVEALLDALKGLNGSQTIAQMEESANHHSEYRFREEMADSLHVAEIKGWDQSPYADDWEVAVCDICGADIEREKL